MQRVRRVLEDELAERFGGFPVRFPVTWDPSVSHRVEVATVADFATSRLGVDPTQGMSVLDWLSVTGQSVLEVTAGPVFADRTRTLAPARALLAWYPPRRALRARRGLAAAVPADAVLGPDRRVGR